MPGANMLSAENISKSYGRVQALNAVTLEFAPGEIHAVLGENGAGKSTLMGVLAGFVGPDSGTVRLGDRVLPLGDPLATRAMGIAMVHQHFMLVPEFTVAENLALGQLSSLRGTLDLETLTAPARELAATLGWQVDPAAHTGSLPVGVQQRVEILKALATDSPVLILDEPTAVLGPDEVEDLFRVLRQLRDQGKVVILIAHKLAEVMAVADRASILRHGVLVGTTPISDTTARQLGEWMVGELPSSSARTDRSFGEEVLRVEELSVRGDRGELAVQSVSLTVRSGEVVGIGGVDGNGQVELAEAVMGIRPGEAGTVKAPEARSYIPQDRQEDGLALEMSVLENMMVKGHTMQELRKGPFLRLGKVKTWARDLVQRFQIKVDSVDAPVRSLSGGNQQKVVVSRALSAEPRLIVAVNPTRGLDFNATEFVHRTIAEAAEGGAAVVLISTDQDELALLADQTKTLVRGELVDADLRAALEGSPS